MSGAKRLYMQWTPSDDDALLDMFPQRTDDEIAAALGRNRQSIINRRFLFGLKRDPNVKTYDDVGYPDDWQADAARGSEMLLEALRAVQ